MASIDMTNALALLNDLTARVRALDGAEVDVDVPNNRSLMRGKARLSQDLQYTGHLADLVAGELTSQFYRFKGMPDVPVITP